jgi:DNA-binding transcriptional LysR family regulator
MFDWNDLKFFLAVARSGSTLAASRQVRASQATVSRRVSVLEEALGVELFARTASGYALTARGEALLPLAEAVEFAATGFSETAGAEARRISGQVRLTTVESAASAWVIPAAAKLQQTHDAIVVEVISTDHNLDLARGEADIAIRFGPRPSDETLIAQRLTDLEECIYASRELVTRLGRPEDFAALARYPLVVETSDPFSRFSDWWLRAVPEGRIAQRVSSLSSVIAAVKAGIGAAMLPSVIGDSLRGVVRLMPPIAELATPCWMVTTEQARRQPHVRAVIDAVVDHVRLVTAQTGNDTAPATRLHSG